MDWAVEYKMQGLARSQVKAAIGLGWTPLASSVNKHTEKSYITLTEHADSRQANTDSSTQGNYFVREEKKQVRGEALYKVRASST